MSEGRANSLSFLKNIALTFFIVVIASFLVNYLFYRTYQNEAKKTQSDVKINLEDKLAHLSILFKEYKSTIDEVQKDIKDKSTQMAIANKKLDKATALASINAAQIDGIRDKMLEVLQINENNSFNYDMLKNIGFAFFGYVIGEVSGLIKGWLRRRKIDKKSNKNRIEGSLSAREINYQPKNVTPVRSSEDLTSLIYGDPKIKTQENKDSESSKRSFLGFRRSR